MHRLMEIDNKESAGTREVGKVDGFNYDGNRFTFGFWGFF